MTDPTQTNTENIAHVFHCLAEAQDKAFRHGAKPADVFTATVAVYEIQRDPALDVLGEELVEELEKKGHELAQQILDETPGGHRP